MPDFETYFDIFHRNLKIDEGQTVHFELGRSLVAQCGELITRALYNKETSACFQAAPFLFGYSNKPHILLLANRSLSLFEPLK